MISQSSVKLIRSLIHKKYRTKHNFFIAEGRKIVLDMLKAGFDQVHTLYLSKEVMDEHHNLLAKVSDKLVLLHTKEFERISNLESIPDVILIGYIATLSGPGPGLFRSGIHLYLDQIQDPGNLGTILRTAEWFGIRSIGLSEGCADLYHPKVIQASMGSFTRVPVWLGTLTQALKEDNIPVLGADLTGASLYTSPLPGHGVLVIGSEGQGISPQSRSCINQYIRIPAYSMHIESLNAANATAIIISEWRRQMLL